MSWAIYSMIQKLGAVQGMAAAVQLQAIRARLVSFLEPYDALLTPALAERPLPLGTLDTAAPDPMSTFTRSGLFTPFTPVFNASGQPGISLPLFQGEDGLPLGVQLVGRPGGRGGAAGARRPARRGAAVGDRGRRSWRLAEPGSFSVSAGSKHGAHRLGRDSQAFGVGRASSGEHRHLHQLGLVPGREGALSASSPRAGAARVRRSGWGRAAAAGRGLASAARAGRSRRG